MQMYGHIRNAAGNGRRMPGDQAEEVRPREADQSREQHRNGNADVELAVAGRGGVKREGRSSNSHAAKDISTARRPLVVATTRQSWPLQIISGLFGDSTRQGLINPADRWLPVRFRTFTSSGGRLHR